MPTNSKRMSEKQVQGMLAYIEILLNQHQAAHQTLQRSGRSWQATYGQILQENGQKREPLFHTLSALLRERELATMIDTLNEELGKIADADE